MRKFAFFTGIIVFCVTLSLGLRSLEAAVSASVPMLEKTVVLDLPFGEDNPRNSEGAFLTLKNGDILYVYTKYKGTSDQDHAPASLAARVSKDGGKTWSAEDRVLVENEGQQNVMSVSLLRLEKSGEIALFYLRKNSFSDCRPYVRFSKDEGESFSEPVLCVADEVGYYVLNNDRVLQRPDGTLLMPLALHSNKEGKFVPGAQILVYLSDDSGRTWTRHKPVANPENFVLQEPGLVELADGRILMVIRSNAGCQCYSYSSDHGKTWSPAERSPLVSPLSPAVIKRIPNSEELLVIWNHSPNRRNPFNIAVLSADGKKVLSEKTLDLSEDDSHWFCYPALHFLEDGRFLAAYCAGEKRIVGLNATRLILATVDEVRKE